jgi:hypothetical protein
LRDPGQMSDVEGGGFPFDLHCGATLCARAAGGRRPIPSRHPNGWLVVCRAAGQEKAGRWIRKGPANFRGKSAGPGESATQGRGPIPGGDPGRWAPGMPLRASVSENAPGTEKLHSAVQKFGNG